MKKFLIIPLLFAALICSGQKGNFFKHTYPPAGPTLVSPSTFDNTKAYSRSTTFAGYAPSSIYGGSNNTTTGKDLIFSGAEPYGMQMNFMPGSVAFPWRMTPSDLNTRLGSSGSLSHGWQTIGNSNNFMLMGSVTIPLQIRVGGNQCGIQVISQSGGTNFLASNVVVRGNGSNIAGTPTPSGSGFQANSKTSNAGYYKSLTFTDCAVDSVGAEGLYDGGTNGINTENDSTGACYVKNFRAAFTWREFLQFHSGTDILVENVSAYSSGNEGTAGQDNLTQWQDVNGLFRNSVLSGGPALANISCVGCKFQNMYWGTTGVHAGFFVNVDQSFATSPRTLSPGIYGDTAIFENMIINKETPGNMGGTGYAFDDNISSHYVIFRNCILSSKFTDFADPTHTRIIGRVGDHGNTSSSSIETPQWISTQAFDANLGINPNFMILNTPRYIKLHMGAYIP